MGISSVSDGTAIQGNRSLSLHIHLNADASNTELLFRIIHSVNQLRAVSNWCEQFGLAEDEKGQERTPDKGESMKKEY